MQPKQEDYMQTLGLVPVSASRVTIDCVNSIVCERVLETIDIGPEFVVLVTSAGDKQRNVDSAAPQWKKITTCTVQFTRVVMG